MLLSFGSSAEATVQSQLMPDGIGRRLGTVGRARLGEDAADVIGDGVGADEE